MSAPRTIDKTGKTNGDARLTLRFTPQQLVRLKKEANKQGMSLSKFVRLKVLG